MGYGYTENFIDAFLPVMGVIIVGIALYIAIILVKVAIKAVRTEKYKQNTSRVFQHQSYYSESHVSSYVPDDFANTKTIEVNLQDDAERKEHRRKSHREHMIQKADANNSHKFN
jgi:hypothetical protein